MNAFLRACGADEPLQVAIRGPVSNDKEVRSLHQPFALVGRDARADITLDHCLVSRCHAYLQIINGETFWIDLNSRLGTFSEGKLRDAGWLDQGKLLRVGPFGLERLQRNWANRTIGAETRVSPLMARSLGDGPLPRVSLEFQNGPLRSASWPMNRVMSLVGSASGCKFRLDDPSVAPFHCCLIRTSLGVWVVDLLGHGGIDVNDTVERYALLADSDVLRVGRYRIRIHSRLVTAEPAKTATSGKDGSIRELTQERRSGVPPALAFPSDGSRVVKDSTIVSLSGLFPALLPSGQVANPEWLSSGNESVVLEKGNISESLLVSVVNQFGMMQQQMLDQFQQTISMLVQTFGNLHREQMETIRRELDEIRDLSREFQALKVELDARAQTQPTPAPAPTLATAVGRELFSAADPPRATVSGESSRRMPKSGVQKSVPPVLERHEDLLGRAGSAAPQGSTSGETSAVVPPLKRTGNQAASGQQGMSDQKPESERDMVVWLHQRMVHLQRERESRWQKILKLLPGLS
ncbi:MAG: FHA domain-containing protein [Isosphaeraceae bacterium]